MASRICVGAIPLKTDISFTAIVEGGAFDDAHPESCVCLKPYDLPDEKTCENQAVSVCRASRSPSENVIPANTYVKKAFPKRLNAAQCVFLAML